jgi:hypothetical protein
MQFCRRLCRLSLLLAPCLHAAAVYDKFFIIEGVDLDGSVRAAGMVETWAGNKLVGGDVLHDTPLIVRSGNPPVQIFYEHADTNTDRNFLNLGFPVFTTLETIGDGYFEGPVQAKDAHKNPNSAEITEVSVHEGLSVKLTAWDQATKSNVEKTLADPSAIVKLSGKAEAGVPIAGDPGVNGSGDPDKYHSANSFAAVDVGSVGTRVWGKSGNGTYAVYGKNLLTGSATQGGAIQGSVSDPYFVTLDDLDSGATITQIVMRQNATYQHGSVSLDDTGISLSIDMSDPDAFAALDFTNAFSWVVNPYSYSLRLGAGGLSASGDEFPLAGWTISTSGNIKSAFFAFGPDGANYDVAEVAPPDELFAPGTTVGIDFGASAGANEIASAPEPSGWILAAGGFSLVLLRRYARG